MGGAGITGTGSDSIDGVGSDSGTGVRASGSQPVSIATFQGAVDDVRVNTLAK